MPNSSSNAITNSTVSRESAPKSLTKDDSFLISDSSLPNCSATIFLTRCSMLSMDNIEQRVKKIVAEQLGKDESEIKNESSFVNDLGADSLDTVELVMALEDEFGIEIPDEEAEKITTVQLAIDFAKSKQG